LFTGLHRKSEQTEAKLRYPYISKPQKLRDAAWQNAKARKHIKKCAKNILKAVLNSGIKVAGMGTSVHKNKQGHTFSIHIKSKKSGEKQ
jgi:hypothetical protein